MENDLECSSPDGTLTKDKALYKFNHEFLKASIETGIDPHAGLLLEERMKAAGFVDVVAQKFIWPVGTWPADKHLVRLPASISTPTPFPSPYLIRKSTHINNNARDI